MTAVRGTADLDREHFVWGRWTRHQLALAAIFAVPSVLLLMVGAVVKASTGQPSPGATGFAVAFAVAAVLVLIVSPRKGLIGRLHRQHFGPQTFVNGPVQTLPKELSTRAYRKAQKRVTALSAPFEGFDEQGRYVVAGGTCRVLRVNPIDMELRSEREREHLGKRFAHLLSTTDEPITIHVAGEPISFEAEVARIRALELNPKVTKAAADYATFLEQMSGFRRQTYVACWGPDGLAADLRADTVAEQLRRMGLDVHRPTPTQMASLTALLSGGQVPYRNYPSEPVVRSAS